ncbi:uncharacterized protein LOC119645382 [Glossina fuscipes]|uniref:Uncharacterized protein LOC119645382 n=1 Tax=Glossina fuscipes TaxID=7396 RepID=A0A9C5ZKM9_9MUSC|nr:uncharacterized protein LOC119645382 [Glossina fuscipes]KAI9587570.1 hypothetical protein GQX74_003416 [Glossina fuscipes]
MSKLSLLAIVFVMIVKGYAKPAATKASITLANVSGDSGESGDSLGLSRNAADILYARRLDNQHAEQHGLNKRETLKEGGEEEALDTNTEAEVFLKTTPNNEVEKDMTKNDRVCETLAFLNHYSTTTLKSNDALKEAEEVLREKVAEIEAEPVILSYRI